MSLSAMNPTKASSYIFSQELSKPKLEFLALSLGLNTEGRTRAMIALYCGSALGV